MPTEAVGGAPSSTGQLVFRNIKALAIAKAATLGGGMVTAVWMARALGPEYYGVLGFGTAVLAYAGLLVNLGLSTLALREIACRPERADELVDRVLSLRLLLAVAVALIYAPAVLALDKPGLVKTVLLVQGAQLFGNALLIDFYYQGTERMGVIAGREVGTALVTMVAVLALVRGPDDVVLAAAISAGSFLLNAALVVLRYAREARRPRLGFEPSAWAAMLRGAAPMAVSLFAWAVFAHLNVIMLGFMAPPADVGWYAVAFKVASLGATAGHIVMNSFLPSLAAAYGEIALMRARMRACATTMAVVGGLVTALGLVLAPAILAIAFGHAPEAAVNAMRLLMASLGIGFLSMTFGNPLLVWHRQTSHMLAILAGGAVNATLNALLIGRWGMEGAATATLAAELTAFLGIAVLHARFTGALHLDLALKAALAAGLAALAAEGGGRLLPPGFAPSHPLTLLVVGGVTMTLVYGVVAWAVGLVDLAPVQRLP